MIQTFDILFRVSFMHSYFKDGRCKEISVVPDQISKKLIQKHGLIFKNSHGGFVVLTESDRTEDLVQLTNSLDTNLQLNFFLSFNNPYLPNVTELKNLEKNQIHFYTNTSLNPNAEDENPLTLSSNLSIAVFQDLKLKDPSDTEIKLEKGDEIFTWNASKKNNPIEDGWDPGVYKVTDGKEETHAYINEQSIPQGAFALLSIDLNKPNILDKEKNLLQPNFLLEFKSRETFWQYIIKKSDKPENLVIESTANNEIFEKTEEVLASNKPVTIFTSTQQIPLSENRDDYFRLKLRNGDPSNDLILISNLPIPNLNTLNRNKEGKFYTQIFVNF